MSDQVPKSNLLKWKFVPETTCIAQKDYVNLEVVDISCLINEPSLPSVNSQIRRDIVDRAFAGFKDVGFIVLTGHGLDAEMISRQFDIGKMFFDAVSEEEKHNYHAKIAEEGSWAGYKPLGYHKRPNGTRDSTEFHDFYPYTVLEAEQPPRSWPYLSEIRSFYYMSPDLEEPAVFRCVFEQHNHFVILRTVLEILSEGLSLPPDSLWNLHRRRRDYSTDKDRIDTKDMFRSAMYHPPAEEDREKSKRLWLPPHTDRGSLTFIFSQPIAGLQVFTDEGWKYIRHYPNGIIVNLCDALEFTTGRLLKAPLHRVSEPPPDQRHLRRLGLIYFATMLPEIPLQPIEALATRVEADSDIFNEYEGMDGRLPTAEAWQVRTAKTTGKAADKAFFKKRFPTHDTVASVAVPRP